jgi:hypothetical protein
MNRAVACGRQRVGWPWKITAVDVESDLMKIAGPGGEQMVREPPEVIRSVVECHSLWLEPVPTF